MRKIKFYKIFLFILVSFLLVFISGIILSQESVSPEISVAPHTFELDVFPGEIRQEKIKIFNQSEVAIPISTRVTDFTAAEESGEMLFDESAQDISIAARKWMKIENPKFILEPWEKGEMRFSIEVPENAEPGGHYVVILFEPTLPSFYFKEDQPRAIPTLGVLFLLSVKTFALEPVPQDQQIEIVEFGLPREQRIANLEKAFAAAFQIVPGVLAAEINIVEKTPSSFVLRIKNNDIFHHKLSGKLLILNIFGKKVGESEIKRTTILPGKIRRFPIEFSPEVPEKLKWLPASISNFLVQNTSFGKYRVILDLGEEKSGLVINQAMAFWAFPWKIFLVLFSLVTAFILARKRIRAAFKALFRAR